MSKTYQIVLVFTDEVGDKLVDLTGLLETFHMALPSGLVLRDCRAQEVVTDNPGRKVS